MAGIYVHIPLCESRCYYCDFYSSTYKGNKEQILTALKKELQDRRTYLKGEVVKTIYLGGGTPSQLQPQEITDLLNCIFENFDCQPEEITIEANPEDLTEEYLRDLRKCPVNRLSLGVQSFSDEDLRVINRRHSAQTAIQAVKCAQKMGFDNISIDLIYGLPNQTMEGWMQNLKEAVGLNVQHISAYSLTFEDGSMLTKMRDRGEIKEVDEEVSFEMFKVLRRFLSENGFYPYEISNFAKKGCESKHNSSYWNYVPYLGVGPSAHSFDGERRRWNVANTRLYLSKMADGESFYEEEKLDLPTQYNEFVMTSLRKSEGVDLDAVESRFGRVLADYFKELIRPFEKDGHVICEEGRYRLSEDGIFISDFIIESLLCVE